MKIEFKKRLKKIIFWMAMSFVALFVFRFIYGYVKTNDHIQQEANFFDSIVNTRKNYASKEYIVKQTNQHNGSANVDQKYEKVAEIKTTTTRFEEEEQASRKAITRFNALIQFEQKRGNQGQRVINLVVGVPPENFDSLYNTLTTIGNIEAKQITKKDKTNEYKELNGRKQSLEKIRNSLLDLKTKGGKIEEFMNLENRILDIEQQLQNLGVSLGDFDDENEFCTVQFSMREGKEIKISIAHRIKVALEWTIKLYLQWVVSLFFMVLLAYITLLLIEKLKLLERMINKK